MLYNDTTWNRLNRLFNIFNPKVYKYLLSVNALLLVWGIIGISLDKVATREFVCLIVIVNLITIPIMIVHCPKRLFFYRGTAEFDDYISMKPKGIMSTNFWWLKVSYTVTEIKQIQFRQNVFEKLFDVGRIFFSGETTFTAKRDEDRIQIKEPFVICGIRNFSEFQDTHSAYRKESE